jgi:hypothetical protein
LTAEAGEALSGEGFDLGPSWFWPDIQPAMGALVRRLGLPAFEQHSDGDMLFERVRGEPPRRLQGMRQEPPSMRIAGGSGALVAALAAGLPASCIRLGARVTDVTLSGSGWRLALSMRMGRAAPRGERRVVCVAAAPSCGDGRVLAAARRRHGPQLARHAHLDGAPRQVSGALRAALLARGRALRHGPEQPGAAGRDPRCEHCVGPGGAVRLCRGAAPQRAQYGEAAIVEAAVRQLARLFGPEAGAPRATLFKDWAADPFTATADDAQAGEHPVSGGLAAAPAEWRQRLWLAGSEAARRDAGYLAGAVEAAEYAVAALIERRVSAP